MNLKIMIPNKIIWDDAVSRIAADGISGAFGILPNHIDFVEALEPGILVLQSESGEETFGALDRGILIKQGDDVLISAINAVLGTELGALRQTVAEEFEALDEREKQSRSALAKLESDFIRRFIEQPR